jgi:hypothetical protein
VIWTIIYIFYGSMLRPKHAAIKHVNNNPNQLSWHHIILCNFSLLTKHFADTSVTSQFTSCNKYIHFSACSGPQKIFQNFKYLFRNLMHISLSNYKEIATISFLYPSFFRPIYEHLSNLNLVKTTNYAMCFLNSSGIKQNLRFGLARLDGRWVRLSYRKNHRTTEFLQDCS